jgi:hypothetical protein
VFGDPLRRLGVHERLLNGVQYNRKKVIQFWYQFFGIEGKRSPFLSRFKKQMIRWNSLLPRLLPWSYYEFRELSLNDAGYVLYYEDNRRVFVEEIHRRHSDSETASQRLRGDLWSRGVSTESLSHFDKVN